MDLEFKVAISAIKNQLDIMSTVQSSQQDYVAALEEVSTDVDTHLEAAREVLAKQQADYEKEEE